MSDKYRRSSSTFQLILRCLPWLQNNNEAERPHPEERLHLLWVLIRPVGVQDHTCVYCTRTTHSRRVLVRLPTGALSHVSPITIGSTGGPGGFVRLKHL